MNLLETAGESSGGKINRSRFEIKIIIQASSVMAYK